MAPQKRMMHLGAFVHEPAQPAGRGRMYFLFLADSAAVDLEGNPDARGRMGKVVKFEPMTVLAALAAVTKHLGFVATSTTTFNQPHPPPPPLPPPPTTTRAPGR